MATPQFLCANWDPGSTHYERVGKYACQNCRLVLVSTEFPIQNNKLTPLFLSCF